MRQTALSKISLSCFDKVVINPVDVVVCPDETAVFSVTSPTQGVTFQWYKNNQGGLIEGATNAIFIINNVSDADAGNYFVVVSLAATPDCGIQNTIADKIGAICLLFSS